MVAPQPEMAGGHRKMVWPQPEMAEGRRKAVCGRFLAAGPGLFQLAGSILVAEVCISVLLMVYF